MPETIYNDEPASRRFYVYAFLRKIDLTYYYVGKGSGKRAWVKGRREIRRPVDSTRIIILKESLTEPDAFDEEIRLIAFYGRKDLGTGILRNLTDGGEGPSGAKHSQKSRDKISAAGIGRKRSQKTRDKMSASKTGANHPNFGKTGANHPLFGKKYKTKKRKILLRKMDQQD